MLQAMVGNYRGESSGCKRKSGCVALHEVQHRVTGSVEIGAECEGGVIVRIETPGSAAKIQNIGPDRKTSQDFMHDGVADYPSAANISGSDITRSGFSVRRIPSAD